MEEQKLKLVALIEKENQLKNKIGSSFSSEEEFNLFVEENKELFMEIKKVRTEIKKIEWELMTDEEKKNHLQYLKDLKEKFND